ncbi:MAG: thiamine phosphate synthase [Bacteroidetes bacterium]|nr:thiamine phosphate synthase [Bacteroidota bacterium]
MKLLVITPSKNIEAETSIVTKMFEAGLPTLHLRKPKFTTQQMKEYLSEIPIHFHQRIVIHSHHKLCLVFPLKGIHLTATHLEHKWRYKWLKFKLRLKFSNISKSKSYGKLQSAYDNENQTFNYYLLGTMFNSLTGNFYHGFYKEGIEALIKSTKKKIIARGGTSLSSIEPVFNMGLYGIAFNSFIWESENPFERFLEITQTFKSLNIEFD